MLAEHYHQYLLEKFIRSKVLTTPLRNKDNCTLVANCLILT